MLKKYSALLTCACLYALFACSEENVAGVTEQENAIAFEVDTPNSYDLWSFEAYRINTGTDDAGNWFSYDNAEMGQRARVVLPTKTDSVLTDEDMAAVIDSCGGLCGTVEFDDSSDSASAGIGFTLGKENSVLDVSAWNGLCVTYESELTMKMKLKLGQNGDEAADDDHFVEFPKVARFSTHCAKWDEFSKGAAKKLRAVLFEFMGGSKKKGSFNIKGVGSYKDVVRQQSEPPRSSSSVESSSSSNKKTCLWNGAKGMEFVNTGFTGDNAGLWYNYDDAEVGGMSAVVWPIPIESPDDAGFAKVLSDAYGSITGMAELKKGPSEKAFAGIGFIMAEDVVENRRLPRVVDISDWGGLCVSYSSSGNMGLLLGKEDDDVLRAQLEPSQGLVEKCVAWNEFENISMNASTSNDELAKEISAVRFIFESDSSSESVDFSIATISTYAPEGACSDK